MFTINYKFYIKYIKIVSNIKQIKGYFKTYIPYLKDISNMKSWIVNQHNQKRQKLDTNIIIRLRKRKK